MPKAVGPGGTPSQIIAIVDDDASIRNSLEALFRSLGFDARVFVSADAFVAADPAQFSLVISDLQMPGMNGLELQEVLQGTAPELPFVLMTAFPQDTLKRRALALGAWAIFEKPFNTDRLVALVYQLVGRPELRS